MIPIERRERTNGFGLKVITFATEFEQRPHAHAIERPAGPFYVSASRDFVMVHRAQVSTRQQFDALIAALNMAWNDRGVL